MLKPGLVQAFFIILFCILWKRCIFEPTVKDMKQSITNLFKSLEQFDAEELHSMWLRSELDFLSEFLQDYLEYYHFEEFVKLEQIRFEESKALEQVDVNTLENNCYE